MSVLKRLITTVLTYLNAAGYYKSAEEVQNAINVAQLDLYKRLRGNLAQYAPGRPSSAIYPEITTTTSDAIGELLVTASGTTSQVVSSTGLVYVDTNFLGRTIDFVISLEAIYPSTSPFSYPINIVPDNQFLMLKNNPVVPPVNQRPIGRFNGLDNTLGLLIYEVAPFAEIPSSITAKAVTLPSPVEFTFVDSGDPIPAIIITKEIDWTIDKLDNLVYGTVAALGFNLSNGVLVQSGNAMNDKIL